MKQVLDAHHFTTLDEAIDILGGFKETAASLGQHPSTVRFVTHSRISLVEETLTDGSMVLNVHLFEGEML